MITTIAMIALGQASGAAYDLVGSVSDLVRQKDGSYRMLVRNNEKPQRQRLTQAVVRTTAKTRFVDSKGRDASSYFRDRLSVAVLFKGGLTKSLPPQGTADTIVVLSEAFDAKGTVRNARNAYNGLHFSVVDDKGQAIAVVTTGPETVVEKIQNGKRVPASRHEIKNGTQVDMSYEGPVALSYPPQGKAGYLLIR